MNTVEQVYPDLFIAKHEMRQDWFCSVLVFLGKNNIGIVDTGFIKTINDSFIHRLHNSLPWMK